MKNLTQRHGDTESWPKVRLGEVVVEVRERVNSSQIDIGQYISTENMVKDRGGVVVAESKPESVGLVGYKPGDVLIANIRPYLKKIWLSNRVGGCSSDVVVYRSNTAALSAEFLYSALSSDEFFDYVMRKTRGTKMPRGDRDWMSLFEIPLPPLSVQREIVARLEKELAAVDRMVKGFEEMKAEADQLFKAELKEAFEDIKRRGAETRRLGEICENLDCRRIPITKSDRKAGMYPYFGASGIVDYVDGYLYDGDYLLVSEDGANLIARSTPIAFSVSGKIWVNNHAHILSFQNISTQYYVEYYFEAISIAEFVTGAAQPKFTQKALNELIIPLPPLATQREVVAKLDAVREKCAKLKSAAEEGLKTAALMRKAILKEAFE